MDKILKYEFMSEFAVMVIDVEGTTEWTEAQWDTQATAQLVELVKAPVDWWLNEVYDLNDEEESK